MFKPHLIGLSLLVSSSAFAVCVGYEGSYVGTCTSQIDSQPEREEAGVKLVIQQASCRSVQIGENSYLIDQFVDLADRSTGLARVTSIASFQNYPTSLLVVSKQGRDAAGLEFMANETYGYGGNVRILVVFTKTFQRLATGQTRTTKKCTYQRAGY